MYSLEFELAMSNNNKLGYTMEKNIEKHVFTSLKNLIQYLQLN